MDNSFKTLIDSTSEILILLPDKPSLDQVSAGLSFHLSLVGSGKNVTISCPVPMTTEFSRLIGVDKVISNSGDKNMSIKFINYEATNVDKVSYDIVDGQFKLTVSPKASFKSPTKEQIEIGYSGISAEFVILIGGESVDSFSILKNPELAKSKIIHISNKYLVNENKDLQILSFAKQASSVSEVVTSLLKEGGFVIDPDIATNLLNGIEMGSRNFQSEGVTSLTFELFAELLKLGGQRVKKVLSGPFPQGSIPTKPYTQQVNQLPINPVIQDRQMTPEEAEQELDQEIPPAWSEPKIFTGTSVS